MLGYTVALYPDRFTDFDSWMLYAADIHAGLDYTAL